MYIFVAELKYQPQAIMPLARAVTYVHPS